MGFWDEYAPSGESDYITFDHPGDTVTGTITELRKHTWNDGSSSPQIVLLLDSGATKTVTAGQVRLRTKLAELNPQIGDVLTITHTEVERRPGGKTLKHFDVKVGNTTSAAAAARPADAPAAASADDLAGLISGLRG